MNRRSKMIHIDSKRCKSCGLCIHFCPKSVLQSGDDINEWGYNAVILTDPDTCTFCGLCQIICPDGAIRVLGSTRVIGLSSRPETLAEEGTSD